MMGSELKAIREALSMTREEFADLVAYSPKHIENIENGHAKVSDQLARHAQHILELHQLKTGIRQILKNHPDG